MLKKLLGVMLVLVLALSIVSIASAQNKKAVETPTMALKSVTCDPACGFMIQSRNEKEITEVVIAHAKSAHNKDLKAEDVKAMMKTVSAKKSKT
jgi:predicted small metal-binding protein